MYANVKKLIYAFLCLLLSVWTGAGVCVSETNDFRLPLNERLDAHAGTTSLIAETSISGNYILYAYCEEEVYASVSLAGEEIASGTLPLSISMPKDVEIRFTLSSCVPFTFEIMRAAHGRNLFSALEMTSSMNRTLTRAYDVHYYAYTAKADESLLIRLTAAIKKGIAPDLLVFSENGAPLFTGYRNLDSTSAFLSLKEGESIFIRVSGKGDETGSYVLSSSVIASDSPVISPDTEFAPIRLVSGEWTRLDLALGGYILTSENENVFTVTEKGVVAATGEGESALVIRDLWGNSVSVPVTVLRAQVTGVEFLAPSIDLHVGEFIRPAYSVLPPYAGNQAVSFSVSDPSVISIGENGQLTGLVPGEAVVTIKTQEGAFTDEIHVTVKEPEPVYRALAVGIATYENERERTGCINTTQGMADALSRFKDGDGYLTSMRLDLTKDELFQSIQESFKGASADDVSLFYINCHGGITAGTAWLEMRHEQKVTAMELEGALRKIPGTVIVIIDCCQSGAFLPGETGESAFASAMISQFTGENTGKSAFALNKYKLLVSSSASQNSYRIASSSPATEQNMSTVFARSLAEGLGWNLIKDKKGTLKADFDNNRQISLHEAWLYTMKRTMSFLNKSTARQTVQVWPHGDSFVIMR